MSKKLGKGLEMIFGDGLEDVIERMEEGTTNRLEIDINQIRVNPYQPRAEFDEEKLQELADSIATHGVFQPILVREVKDGYELIAGERRLRASKIAKKATIPAIIVDFNDKKIMEIALLENIQRENLNAIEEAKAYDKLMKRYGYTQEILADRMGKSRAYVANLLRLLRLPASVQKHVIAKKLTMGHVRALLPLEDDTLIEEVAQKIMQEKLSVRAVENLVKKLLTRPQIKKQEKNKYLPLQNDLQDKLQTTVKVEKNQIVIKFNDTDDLNRILELLHLIEE